MKPDHQKIASILGSEPMTMHDLAARIRELEAELTGDREILLDALPPGTTCEPELLPALVSERITALLKRKEEDSEIIAGLTAKAADARAERDFWLRDSGQWESRYDEKHKLALSLEAERDAAVNRLAEIDRVLRASVRGEFKGCTSPVGAVQNEIGALEQELRAAVKRSEAAEATSACVIHVPGKKLIMGDFSEVPPLETRGPGWGNEAATKKIAELQAALSLTVFWCKACNGIGARDGIGPDEASFVPCEMCRDFRALLTPSASSPSPSAPGDS